MNLLCICALFDWIVDRDNFKDFVWPGITTIIGILASVFLAKYIFDKERREIKQSKNLENSRLKRIVSRNALIIADKTKEDAIGILKVYVEKYNIENGIVPIGMKYSLAELDIITAIGSLKIEEIFVKDFDDESHLVDFYLAISGITEVKYTYQSIADEVSKINNFIGEYDIIILERYKIIIEFVTSQISKSKLKDLEVDLEKEVSEFFDFITSPKSEMNNFHELKVIVDGLKNLAIFPKVVNDSYLEYVGLEESFMISYLKFRQELFLYHNRIRYLTARLQSYGKNLRFFRLQ